jgi:hypothetical protein
MIEYDPLGYTPVYDVALSYTSLIGCSTCNSLTDVSTVTPPTGDNSGSVYNFEYFGIMITD